MITIQKLHKEYNNKIVLQNVSFKAKKGEITGLIGPNGSGKSTLIRILLGLENSQMGMALIDGKKYSQLGDNPFCIVGSFLDSCQPYPTRTGFQHLRWIGLACGVDKNRCNECLELVGLSEAKNKKVKDYSLGMKQRLGLATALLANPDILILDEPINGLDPEGIRWVRNFLQSFVYVKSLAAYSRTSASSSASISISGILFKKPSRYNQAISGELGNQISVIFICGF